MNLSTVFNNTTIRLVFLALLTGLLLLTPAQAQPQPPLDEALTTATVEFNLPAGLLPALGWSRSHLRPQVSDSGEVGVMQLTPAQISRAAALLQEQEAALQNDNRQNIRAAAALLRQEADRHFPDRETLAAADWFEVVAAVSFPDDPAAGRSHARQVFTLLHDGLDVDIDGERITVTPWPDAGPLIAAPEVSIASEDYAPAYWSPANSANYTPATRNAEQIDTIVIHTTEGYYQAVLNWFASPASRVSAHYVIRSSDGAVAQTVRDQDIAWHAGDWETNTRSIGIEHEAFVNDASWYSAAMYRTSARLVVHLAQQYNIPLDRQHIIGHNEVPGCPNPGGGGATCHTDPGQHWDWDYFMSLVRAVAPPPTATPRPTPLPSPTPTPTAGPQPPPLTNGNLIGLVYDAATRQRLGGATITANGQTVQANQNGVYLLTGLPPGSVTVQATYPGYAPVSRVGWVIADTTRWNSMALTSDGGLPTPSPTPPATATPQPTPTATASPTPGPIFSPTPTPLTPRGTLVGLVQDSADGRRLAGVTVSAGGQTFMTDARGFYRFDGLPAGPQVVTAVGPGYAAGRKTGVVVAGQVRWNSLKLTRPGN